jgi:carbamoyl-phosphate synthase large subunit
MNILLTSVGRRGYLVRYFQEALAGRGQVVATNTIAETTGMFAADVAVVVPAANDPKFIDKLLEVCQRYQISLLCSLHDWEAPYIAAAKERFLAKGIFPVIADIDVILTCLDKWKTVQFARSLNIPVPKSYISLELALSAISTGELRFPLILKPRCGQGSVGIQAVSSCEDLKSAYSLLEQEVLKIELEDFSGVVEKGHILIQECINGREYGVDVVNTLSGEYAACFVKEKLGMRAGETDASTTVDMPKIQGYCQMIASATRHPGNIDIDYMVSADGIPYLLEINPRFGGGYPFSHAAGANVPAALISWSTGQEPEPRWLEVELGVTAYKELMIIKS